MKILKTLSLIVSISIICSCDSSSKATHTTLANRSFSSIKEAINPSLKLKNKIQVESKNTSNSEITHCNWSKDGVKGYQNLSVHIGEYTLCLGSKNDKNGISNVYIQTKQKEFDSEVCIIPTYNGKEQTFYIGRENCIRIDDNKTVYKVKLKKNSPGFQDFRITGAMIIKDKMYFYPSPFYQNILAPDAYFHCIDWMKKTGDNSYCKAFQDVPQYVFHKFKLRL
jgi:hypothetical protein